MIIKYFFSYLNSKNIELSKSKNYLRCDSKLTNNSKREKKNNNRTIIPIYFILKIYVFLPLKTFKLFLSHFVSNKKNCQFLDSFFL